MNNSIDTLLRSVGQTIWEIRVMSETAGDTLLDTPIQVTKRHRVYGIFRLATKELFELVGISTQGDAVLFTRERISLTSQLEHNSIKYEITEEVQIEPIHTGDSWIYILHRHPKRTPTS